MKERKKPEVKNRKRCAIANKKKRALIRKGGNSKNVGVIYKEITV